jgi:membrane-bound lytic murein transglycosylase A
VTADVLRDWLHAQPDGGRQAMQANPSYVFFRRIEGLSAQEGPLGTQGVPLTPLRSVAVDPAFVPLGAPVWIEAETDPPLRGLCLAQDTGGAIRGPQRADIFFGTGPVAGLRAGRTVAGGRMLLLLPRDEAG